ncbi:hypothetical protein COOONC_03858 [Cooperia oncophora]
MLMVLLAYNYIVKYAPHDVQIGRSTVSRCGVERLREDRRSGGPGGADEHGGHWYQMRPPAAKIVRSQNELLQIFGSDFYGTNSRSREQKGEQNPLSVLLAGLRDTLADGGAVRVPYYPPQAVTVIKCARQQRRSFDHRRRKSVQCVRILPQSAWQNPAVRLYPRQSNACLILNAEGFDEDFAK